MTLDCTCNRLKEAEEKAAKWDAVVRCRECVHHYTRNVVNRLGEVLDTDHFCELMLDGFGEGDNRVDSDHFCSWGKRREGE